MGIDDLPPTHGEDREAAIRKMVCEEMYYDEIDWEVITSEVDGLHGKFYVMSDALQIEGVRINVTAETAQHIADSMGCCMLTAKLADLIWEQRQVTLTPSPQSISSTTAAMKEHSARLDAQLAKLGQPKGLKATVGKDWVIDPDCWTKKKVAQQAVNYGWHFRPGNSYQGITGNITASLIKDPETKQYVHMIQSRGFHHDIKHVDYSQTLRLVAKLCVVDGQETSVADVLRDPLLAKLVSHNGPLPDFRHPFVEQKYTGALVIGRSPSSANS